MPELAQLLGTVLDIKVDQQPGMEQPVNNIVGMPASQHTGNRFWTTTVSSTSKLYGIFFLQIQVELNTFKYFIK